MGHAVAFVKNRKAFGQSVADYQGVRWMLADMAIKIETARGLVYRAAASADAGVRGKELASIAAMAKCFATDTAMQVATDAVQLFGAPGNFERLADQSVFPRRQGASDCRRHPARA
jgi:alkylation response protein AidB-like acyl-CoA dehydrogenase